MRPLGSTGPWAAGAITPRATALLAPNPSWMTLDGTNSWLLAEPGADRAILVDPGPDDPDHLTRLVNTAAGLDARIAVILLTHGHDDHSAGAKSLHELTGAPVRALDPRHRLGDEGLADGDVVTVGDLEVSVLGTPGHTRDSLTFLLPADGALLTGDTVLGRGSAVIAHPDGHLGCYLESLRRLSDVAGTAGARGGFTAPDPVHGYRMMTVHGVGIFFYWLYFAQAGLLLAFVVYLTQTLRNSSSSLTISQSSTNLANSMRWLSMK